VVRKLIDIFISNADILRDATSMSKVVRQLFPKIDVVCGIPRGGNLPANIISTRLAMPCTTPDLLLRGECWWTSSIFADNNRHYYSNDFTVKSDFSNAHILLVDDTSFNKIGTLERVKQTILAKFPNATIYKSSVYSMWNTKDSLDFYCKVISRNHWFEKDFLIRKIAAKIAVDMDGFLCRDVTFNEVQDDVLYAKFLRDATGYMIPYYQIDYIVTARLEKHRRETEEWLSNHKVHYGMLFMRQDGPRIGLDDAKYKADWLKRGLADFYIESNYVQAKRIYQLSNVQTMCVEPMQLFGATNIGYEYHIGFKDYKNFEHPIPESNVELGNLNKPKHTSNWLFP
jgi:hypoxanthine phosphoribosyltransferase